MLCSRAIAIMLVGYVVAGCDAPFSPPGESQGPVENRMPGGSGPLTMDELWAELADQEIPGFAGHVLDGHGNSVVYVAKSAGRSPAAEYVRKYRQSRGLGNGTIRTVPVAFDFRQLKTWADQLAGLTARPGIVLMDIDERENRILLGVSQAAEIGSSRKEAARRGVPPEAVEVRIVEAPEPFANLNSFTRPLVGGLATINSVTAPCTLGVTAIYQGTWGNPQHVPGFITASHCSSHPFELDNSVQYQPELAWAPYAIGNEYVDYPRQQCNWLNICSSRKSDAAFFANSSGLAYQIGYIARPELPVGIGGKGSLTIDAVNPRFEITLTAWSEETIVGLWLNKVGMTSGWTRGQVTQTCVNVSGLVCQYVSSVWAEPGDSGAPVFSDGADSSSPAGSQVTLHGILWGGNRYNSNVTYFSHIGNVSWDLGYFCVTSSCY